MIKAADALAEAGYRVRVVSTRYVGWATRADDEVRRMRVDAWDWTPVVWSRESNPWLYWTSGLRHRVARAWAAHRGPSNLSFAAAAHARLRVSSEVVKAAVAEPADLFYGGGGALAETAQAARLAGVPFALDLEDFHSAEQYDAPASRLAHAVAGRIEREVLPEAVFLTAGSGAIADAYERTYGIRPTPIHNTFPLPATAPAFEPSPDGRLRLYWFSQTVGPDRGLEDAVRAVGLANISVRLSLRGSGSDEYLSSLRRLAADCAPGLDVVHLPPAPPDDMVRLAYDHDAGLALEQPTIFNRQVCLTNKAFTYMLAGLAIAFTDTEGQRPLAKSIGEGAALYGPGDVPALAASLRRWAEDPAALYRARVAAWNAARTRWHWEYATERGALLKAVACALSPV